MHARLELRGWDVVLIDNNSTNGTFIHVPKTPDWQRMPPGAEHILVQGTRIRIGHRTLAFNTHAGSSAADRAPREPLAGVPAACPHCARLLRPTSAVAPSSTAAKSTGTASGSLARH